MKGDIFLSLMVLLWVLVFTGVLATGDDLNGVLTGEVSSSHEDDVSKVKNAPPGLVKEDGKQYKDKEEKLERQAKTSPVKDKIKNLDVRNDKPLKEPKAPDDLIKQSLDEGSNKKMSLDSETDGCDPSNRCFVMKKMLVACLRVPGTDSHALSLLIQNQGKETVDVNIIAPSFVSLVQTILQINSKEDKELEVYVKEDSSNDSLIVLQAGESNCSLDLRNVIPNSIDQNEMLTVSWFFIRTSTRYAVLGAFLAAALVITLGWLYLRFRKRCSKYQKLELGLPVSTGGKKEADNSSDGWEDTWGSGWDEEETPMTPSKSIPNPSLKGLASRRLNKDGWKD